MLPFLSFYLTGSEYGIRGYLTVIVTNMTIIGALSLQSYYIKYSLKSDRQLELIEEKSILSFHLYFNTLIFFLLLLFGKSMLKAFEINEEIADFLPLSLFTFWFESLYTFYLLSLRIKHKAKTFFLISSGRVIVQYLSIIVLLKFFNLSLTGVYYSIILGYLFFLVFPIKFIISRLTFKLNKDSIKKAILFSLPILGSAIAVSITASLDRIILERHLSLEELGIYVFAATIATTLNALASGAYKYLEPLIYKISSHEDLKKFQTIIQFYVSILMIGAISINIATPYFFEYVINSSYSESRFYVGLILIIVYLNAIVLILDTIMVSIGKHVKMSKITIISSLIATVTTIILCDFYSIYGILIGLGLTLLMTNAYLLYQIKLPIKQFYISNVIMAGLLFLVWSLIQINFSNELFGLKQLLLSILFLTIGFLHLINGYNRFQREIF
jgi:O-antigen/teichoic acid export membrane protein